MICPHETRLSATSIKCAAMPELKAIAGPQSPHYPCDRCRAQWVDETPPDPTDKATWTPTLLEFITAMHRGRKPASPKGIGDTIARGLAAIGIRRWKGCGCAKWQRRLNKLLPFPPHWGTPGPPEDPPSPPDGTPGNPL